MNMHDGQTTRTRRPARVLVGGFFAAALIAGVGCGGDDDESEADSTTAPTAVSTAAPTTASTTTDAASDTTHASGHGDGPTIAVNAVDYAFQDLPESVPAGSQIALANSSATELHEIVVLGPLPADETRSVPELLALPEDQLPAIEPVLVMLAPPGEQGFAVVGDGTLTEPGRYAVICAIPVGADPAEYLAAAEAGGDGPPQVEGGPPHFTEGMFAELTVE